MITPIGQVNRWYRYDKYDRLQYAFVNYPPGDGGQPADPNFIVDSQINYPNYPGGNEPYPPLYANGGSGITGYTMDAHGRISKVWQLSDNPHDQPQLVEEITYDTNGNLPLPDSIVTYDDKVNPYRTNKIWQFLFKDYSRNNKVKIDYFYFTQYNSFGLPLNLRNLTQYPYYQWLFGLEDYGDDMKFVYACSMPKGPIEY